LIVRIEAKNGDCPPLPMAFCAIGYSSWVARMSGCSTV
jgi:hypothetical protein